MKMNKCAVNSLKFVFVLCVGISVGLNLTGCGGVLNTDSAKAQTMGARTSAFNTNKVSTKNSVLDMMKDKTIFKQMLDEKDIEDLHPTLMRPFVHRMRIGERGDMFVYMSEVITRLRDAGYNQTQLTEFYMALFDYYGGICESWLNKNPKKLTQREKDEFGECDYYINEMRDKVPMEKANNGYKKDMYAYEKNEIPKLVAAEYNKPLTADDFYEAQKRLKKLSDEDLGIPLQRKAELDEMVENLSSEELAGIVSSLDTAISELRLSGLTQEQASVVLTDVFFRYANECERAQNSTKAVCETYYTEFAHQMMRKDGRRDYLTYARSVIPAKVVLAYTSDIKEDRRKVDEAKREFDANSNAGLNAGDKSGISWQQVFELIVELAKVASKFM